MLGRVPRTMPYTHDTKSKTKKPDQRPSTKRTRRRHPTLARVLIENSSVPSQIAMVRPSEIRRQRSASHSRSSSEPPKSRFESTTAASTPDLPQLPPPYFPSDPLPKQMAPVLNKPPRHQPSSNFLSKPRDMAKHGHPGLIPYQSTSSPAGLASPTSKLKTPASRIDLRLHHNIRPNTLYSIDSARTGSTKLGEIPMHKWAEPWDHEAAGRANMEALAGGWPAVTGQEVDRPKKAGWKRWFSKKD